MSEHSISQKTLSAEYGEAGVLALMFVLGGVCMYPSNEVTNFLIPEVLTSVAYSQTIGALLVALSLLQAVPLVVRHIQGRQSGQTINLTFALAASFMIVVYGLVFSYIGFYTATTVLLFALSYFIDDEARSARASLFFTAVSLVVITLLFKTFKIYLPPSLFM